MVIAEMLSFLGKKSCEKIHEKYQLASEKTPVPFKLTSPLKSIFTIP